MSFLDLLQSVVGDRSLLIAGGGGGCGEFLGGRMVSRANGEGISSRQ